MNPKNPTLAIFLSCASMAAEKPTGPTGGPDAAPVQMLVPGFAVRELPVQLKAINNLRSGLDKALSEQGMKDLLSYLMLPNP